MYKTHSGNTHLNEVKKKSLIIHLSINGKEQVMLKKLFRAMILSRAASAANQTLETLSDRQLDDMGFSRTTFVSEIVNSVRKDLNTAENDMSHRQMINRIVNPNLAGSV